MADLVRDHVGLREVAAGVKALAQLVVEAEVDVDLLVVRAIERTDRFARGSAARARRAAEQHHPRVVIAADLRAPGLLDVFENEADVMRELVLLRGRCWRWVAR